MIKFKKKNLYRSMYFIVQYCVLSILFVGCKSNEKKKGAEDYLNKLEISNVSIIRLISNPEAYNGRHVRIKGFISIGFESNAVYLHKEDHESQLSLNAIWLNLSKQQMQKYAKENCNEKYVFIEGVFDTDDKGHMSVFSGALDSISRVEIAENKRHLIQK